MTTNDSEGDRCAVGKALDQLTEAEREDVQAILDNSVASVIISQWFTKMRGFKGCSTQTVTTHRRGDCGCS